MEAAALLLAITQAVQHAHERGVLHRDLKPGNILLDTEDRPLVADFGLARRFSPERGLSMTGVVEGTPAYMAPEVANGARGITVTADVYSLGAMLYELLTGAPPKSEGIAVSSARLINPTVPHDLDAICLKCLEHDPENRYASAAALAEDLDHFLHGEPVSVQPPGVWDWLVHAMRTRPHLSPEYTWSAPIWLGGITFAQHAAICAFIHFDQPMWTVFTAFAASWFGLGAAIWFLLLRRFRLVPLTERHSIVVSIANVVAQVVLLFVIVPLNVQAPSREFLPYYPSMFIVSGLCFVVIGTTNWGRFLPIGLIVMGFALAAAAWPNAGPPLYTVVISGLLIWWGLAVRWYFIPPRSQTQPAPLGTTNETAATTAYTP
jgi:hypothetical protein